MPESVILLLVLFFVLAVGLGVSLSSYAFGDPDGFLQMLPIWKFVANGSAGRVRWTAYSVGVVILILLLLVSFVFGAFTVTFLFDLWTSPVFQLLEPK